MSLDYYFQVLVSLFFIGSILFVVYKISLNYKQKIFSGDLILKDRLAIDKNSSVVVINYKDKNYLLSVSEKEIGVIDELPLSSD
jgi:flagellar biogenesis protein FliO